jgi:hypothetical protein
LFEITAVVPVSTQISPQAVLTIVMGTGAGIGTQNFEAATCVGQRQAAQLFPSLAASLLPNRTSHSPSGGGTVTLSPRLGLMR